MLQDTDDTLMRYVFWGLLLLTWGVFVWDMFSDDPPRKRRKR